MLACIYLAFTTDDSSMVTFYWVAFAVSGIMFFYLCYETYNKYYYGGTVGGEVPDEINGGGIFSWLFGKKKVKVLIPPDKTELNNILATYKENLKHFGTTKGMENLLSGDEFYKTRADIVSSVFKTKIDTLYVKVEKPILDTYNQIETEIKVKLDSHPGSKIEETTNKKELVLKKKFEKKKEFLWNLQKWYIKIILDQYFFQGIMTHLIIQGKLN